MISTRIKSMLLTAVMLMSVTASSAAVRAAGETNSETALAKIPLTVEYMGKGATPAEEGETSAHLVADDKAGTGNSGQFWVSVAAKSTADGLKMSDSDKFGLFTQGIFSLEMTFAYNSDFIEPYYASAATKLADFEAALNSGNKSSANSKLNWMGDYTITPTINMDMSIIDGDEQTENMSIPAASTSWKMCKVDVNFDGTNIDNLRFKGFSTTDDADKQYLLKIPFRLKDVPTQASAKVLKLVRNPELLTVGSGQSGRDYKGAWEKTDDKYTDYNNLKNIFDYGGDIVLFGGSEVISNIGVKPYEKPAEGSESTDPVLGEALTMYRNDTLTGDNGFLSGTTDYYIGVSNDIEKVQIAVESSDTTVTINGEAATLSGEATYTLDVPLKVVDPSTVNDDKGFNNKIVVESGGETYTVYIRRAADTTIVFKPGNSPYGLIERMRGRTVNGLEWTDTVVAAAKEAFKNSDATYGNLTYGSNYTYTYKDSNGDTQSETYTSLEPEFGQTELMYTAKAWESTLDSDNKPINYDMNEDALFVYESNTFKDPGFTVYDESGNPVDKSKITTKLVVTIMNDGAVPSYESSGIVDDGYEIFETDGAYSLASQTIQPGVYFIEYSYKDDDEQTFTFKRPVVILSKRGDIQITKEVTINQNDYTSYRSYWEAIAGNSNGKIFTYRSADIQWTEETTINQNDYTTFRSSWETVFADPDNAQFYDSSILQ